MSHPADHSIVLNFLREGVWLNRPLCHCSGASSLHHQLPNSAATLDLTLLITRQKSPIFPATRLFDPDAPRLFFDFSVRHPPERLKS
jgi:hypothetical protein